MSAVDPATGRPLPAGAIQRVLFVGARVHVYQIPPLTSTKGYTAASWTEDARRHIFTARLRVLETGVEEGEEEEAEAVSVAVVLEDPASGQLFAAAPYTEPGVVEAALDSARFFALRVQDGQGRRAVLGIGFEERPDAFDFAVALQEARKAAGLGEYAAGGEAAGQATGATGAIGATKTTTDAESKRDYSLKDGETITVNLGSSKFGRRSGGGSTATTATTATTTTTTTTTSGFSLPPPPSASSFALPPPPPPASRRSANRRSVGDPSVLGGPPPAKSAAELGFDDGQFGEFA